ncbi:MAG: hypothetical protein JW993_02615 [Sedimentisphaerales bacterium]|nr:hypothetical protein [Sedimentisphaerales bacterium]
MRHLKRRYLLGAIALAAGLVVGLIVWRLCCPPPLYRVTILPSLGGQPTFARSLNDRGQVAGMAGMPWEDNRLFLWDREKGIRDLGPMVPSPIVINNAGQISSTMLSDANQAEAFLWEPGKGRMRLGPPGDKGSDATAMNNRGQIVGYSYDSAGHVRSFRWAEAAGMTQLHTPDGPNCAALSINDAGQILVKSIGQGLSSDRWFLLDPNGSVSLDVFPRGARPYSINNASCIAAVEHAGGPRLYLLFADRSRTWKRLFRIEAHSPVTRVNDRNQIAYTEYTQSGWDDLEDRFVRSRFPLDRTVSYLWDPVRGRIPLDRYLRGLRRFMVEDLNNEGSIIGTAETKDGQTRPVLLEPIPGRWGR